MHNHLVWQTVSTESTQIPSPRCGHTAVTFGDEMFIFLNDFWSFNLITKKWTALPYPKLCETHGSIAVVVGERMFVVGGSICASFHFKTRQWTIWKTTGDSPYPLVRHCAVAVGNVIIVVDDKVSQLDTTNMSWTTLCNHGGPGKKSCASMCFLNGDLYHFGGKAFGVFSQDLFRFRITDNEWEKIQALGEIPSRRAGHSAISTNSNTMIVFGGYCGEDVEFNDVYEFNPMGNFWRKVNCEHSPYARSFHSAVLYRDRMIVFGGEYGSEEKVVNVCAFRGQTDYFLNDVVQLVLPHCAGLQIRTLKPFHDIIIDYVK